jgi:ATP-dependent Lon protease
MNNGIDLVVNKNTFFGNMPKDLDFKNTKLELVDGVVHFLGQVWEVGKKNEHEHYLFSLVKNKIFRTRIYYQKNLENIVGEVRVRIGVQLYELVCTIRSKNSVLQEIDLKANVKDLLELAWKEIDDYKVGEKLEQSLQQIDHKEEKDTNSESDLKSIFESLGIDNYSKEFEDENISFDVLKFLEKEDLKKLIPKIGDRIKFQLYLEEEKEKEKKK